MDFPAAVCAGVAVLPGVAVAQACVNCYNNHRDSPGTDVELGDVTGG